MEMTVACRCHTVSGGLCGVSISPLELALWERGGSPQRFCQKTEREADGWLVPATTRGGRPAVAFIFCRSHVVVKITLLRLRRTAP